MPGRLTSAEYAKIHGAAAGRELHREREARFKQQQSSKPSSQAYTRGPWRSHEGYSNPKIERNATQYRMGRNMTDLGLRMAFKNAPGLVGRGVRHQVQLENSDAFRPGSLASKSFAQGGVPGLARVLAERSKIIEATGKGRTADFGRSPFSKLVKSNELGDKAYGWVYHKTRDVHLRPDVYDAIGERGTQGPFGATRPKDAFLGPYKGSMKMNPSLANAVLLHELVHSYAQSGTKNLPKWLAEGEAHAVERARAKPAFNEMGMPYNKYRAHDVGNDPYTKYALKYVKAMNRPALLRTLDNRDYLPLQRALRSGR